MEDDISADIVSTLRPSPALKLDKIRNKYGLKCKLVAKCEFFNYGNCIESRLCNEFLTNLVSNGKINPNSTIISGMNVPLLLTCRLKGYECVAVTNELNSQNREMINLMKAIGVKIIDNICLKEAEKLFSNPFVIDEIVANESMLNILKEIIEACDYDIDLLIVGRQYKQNFDIVTEYVSQWIPYCNVIGFVTSEEEDCSDEQLLFIRPDEAAKMTRTLISKEGLLCGVDSGAAVVAAIKSAKELDEDQTCVVLLPDGIFNFMHDLAIDSYTLREKVRKESKMNSWLWQIPVENMATNMNRCTVTSDTKCSEVVRLMKRSSLKEMAVLSNKDSSLLGIVTAADILDKILSGAADYESAVHLCSRNNYEAMSSHESVGKLMFLLESNAFVVVVDYVESTQQRFIGMFTQVDALNYFSYSTFSGK